MRKSIESIFVDIIKNYLELPNDYGTDEQGNIIPCVTIASQNIKLFNTPKLQITIKTLNSNVFSNRRYEENIRVEDKEVYQERVVLNEKRTMQIDIFSRNNEARERFNEVQLALSSVYAEQAMDKYQFTIGHISNAINLSGLDGGSDINRYTIRFNCISWQEKTKIVDYYNTFRTTLQDEKNIIADFTIQEEEDSDGN